MMFGSSSLTKLRNTQLRSCALGQDIMISTSVLFPLKLHWCREENGMLLGLFLLRAILISTSYPRFPLNFSFGEICSDVFMSVFTKSFLKKPPTITRLGVFLLKKLLSVKPNQRFLVLPSGRKTITIL